MELTIQLQEKYKSVYDKLYTISDRKSYVIGQEIDQDTNMLLYVIRLDETIVWQYAIDVNIIPEIIYQPPTTVTINTQSGQ